MKIAPDFDGSREKLRARVLADVERDGRSAFSAGMGREDVPRFRDPDMATMWRQGWKNAADEDAESRR